MLVDGIILGAFRLIIFGLPLVFLPEIFLSFELPKVVFFRSLVLIIWLCLGIKIVCDGKIHFLKLPPSPRAETQGFMGCGANRLVWTFLFGLITVFILSTIFSISPHISFWGSYERQQGLFQFIHCVLFFLALILFFCGENEKKYLRKLIDTACFGALITAIIAIAQKFFVIRVYGTVGQPNFLANYLLMMLPFLVARLFEEDITRRQKFLRAFAIFAVLTAIILTFSRAAIIGMLAGYVFFCIISKRKKMLAPIFLLGAIFVLINVFSFSSLINDNVFLSRFMLKGQAFMSAEARFEIWPAVIKQIEQKPFLGSGPEMMSEDFAKFAPASLLKLGGFNDTADKAHNEFLDIASSIGLFGLFAYLAFFIVILKISFSHRNKPLVLAGLTSLVALFVANMFGFSTTIHFVFQWFVFAVLLIKGGEKVVVPLKLRLNKVVRIIAGATFAVLLGYVGFITNIKPIFADYYYNQAISAVADKNLMAAPEYFDTAINTNPQEAKYLLMGAEYNLMLVKVAPSWRGLKGNLLNTARKYLDKIHLFGAEKLIDTLYLEAKYNVESGDLASADAYFLKANQSAPTSPKILIQWALNLQKEEKYAQSFEKLEVLLKMIPYWDEAFTVEKSDKHNRERFALFFKQNPNILNILVDASRIAKLIGDIEKSAFYAKYNDELRRVIPIISSSF